MNRISRNVAYMNRHIILAKDIEKALREEEKGFGEDRKEGSGHEDDDLHG